LSKIEFEQASDLAISEWVYKRCVII